MNALKIGLLVNDKFCNKYVHELVFWAQQQENVEMAELVIFKSPPTSILEKTHRLTARQNFGHIASVMMFRLVLMIEKVILRFSTLHREHFNTLDLSERFDRQVTIESSVSPDGLAHSFAPDQVRRVRDLGLDLLITYGPEIMQDEILQTCRLGIISVRGAGNEAYRDGPIGFWECYHKHPKTGFVIQSVTQGNVRSVLLSGFFSTKFLFSLNQASLFRKISPHLQQLLKQVASTGKLPAAQVDRPYSGVVLHFPNFFQSVHYLTMVVIRIGMRALYKLVSYQKKWEISFIASGWKKAVLWKSIKAKAPRGRFWADPFIYARDGKTYCFVEDYVYKTKRAHISVLEVSETGTRQIGECIKEPFHLSFPFLFNYDGQLYMCPECSGSLQIRIYRCVGFPLQWELASVAMDNILAADTMIFKRAGVWWMLTSIDKSAINDYCSELYLFSSSSPLATDWKAHPQNPIRIDSEGGRNAGLLFDGEKIFRMAQRHGYDQYGQGLLMYEVTELSETVYSEKLFSTINPNFKKGLLGVHHMSTTGQITVFDHISRSFIF